MRSTERSRGAEINLAWRQRQFANDPSYTPCGVCGQLLKGMGHGAHRRQHILNGDIDVELPHECEECGERYETSNALGDHRRRGHGAVKKKTANDHPDRVVRRKFVDSIAKLPYREFVERLLG
jgi:hypothetical protein